MSRMPGGGVSPRWRVGVLVGAGFILVGIIAAASVVTDTAMILLAGAFWASIVVGIAVRLVRAKRGARIRSAFGPVMGAAEEYQRLYTTQPGLAASVDYALRQQQDADAEDQSSQSR